MRSNEAKRMRKRRAKMIRRCNTWLGKAEKAGKHEAVADFQRVLLDLHRYKP